MVRLAFRDADPDPVALGGERHKDDKALLETGQTVSAKNHLFDGNFDDLPA